MNAEEGEDEKSVPLCSPYAEQWVRCIERTYALFLKDEHLSKSGEDITLTFAKNPLVRDAVSLFFRNNVILRIGKGLKNIASAQFLRSVGNKLFERGLFQDSVHMYNRAAVYAMTDTSEPSVDSEMSLILGNRSAAFFRLHRYDLCAIDLNAALDLPCSDRRRSVLTDRLSRTNTALRSSQSGIKNGEDCTGLNNVLHHSYNMHPHLCIDQNQAMGRMVISKEDITRGELLIEERAYASLLVPSRSTTHCEHCAKLIDQAVPCQSCSSVSFCSRVCRDTAENEYHRYECPFVETLRCFGLGHLALRAILVTHPIALVEVGVQPELWKDRSTPGWTGADNPDPFRTNNFASVFHMAFHPSFGAQKQVPDLLLAKALHRILVDSNYTNEAYRLLQDEWQLPSLQPSSDQFSDLLLDHLYRLILLIRANAFTISLPTRDGRALEDVSSGIYPIASLLNHSCDPNALQSFHGSVLIGRAAEDVTVGDQLFFSYGLHYLTVSRARRREILLEQYHFVCMCRACIRESGD